MQTQRRDGNEIEDQTGENLSRYTFLFDIELIISFLNMTKYAHCQNILDGRMETHFWRRGIYKLDRRRQL